MILPPLPMPKSYHFQARCLPWTMRPFLPVTVICTTGSCLVALQAYSPDFADSLPVWFALHLGLSYYIWFWSWWKFVDLMNCQCNIFIYSLVTSQHLLNKPLAKRKINKRVSVVSQLLFWLVEILLRMYIVYCQCIYTHIQQFNRKW